MDLGLAGRTAIVCASSRGLGKACASALAREGCHVIINGLDGARLQAAGQDIRASAGAQVTCVQADITTNDGRQRLIAAAPEADILINNNAGPMPGTFEDWDHDQWLDALEANLLAPIFMIQALLPGMRGRKFGRIVNITSAMVTSPRYPRMGLSITARTGLTGMSKALAREVAVDNVTINNMLPERFDTDRQVFMAERKASLEGISYEDARRQIADTLPAKRFGRPEEFGDACAFLCAANSGFITGQNLHLDGGSYEGLV